MCISINIKLKDLQFELSGAIRTCNCLCCNNRRNMHIKKELWFNTLSNLKNWDYRFNNYFKIF